MIKIIKQLAIALTVFSVFFVSFGSTAYAEQTSMAPYSWDPGLYATAGRYGDTTHAWGRRATPGAWGTGSVNYQAGSTTTYRVNGSGTLDTVMRGTYCPGGACAYGSGSGYKGLVQFWNDPENFIAFGLIKDPGVSPNGTTLMIEGAAYGKPIGGYWGANGITGASHHWEFVWESDRISVKIDNKVVLGPYMISMTGPSVSFLTAGRDTGDIADTTFDGITFGQGSTVAQPIYVPAGAPYATYTGTLNEAGSGTGHSAYINMHDAHNNAVAVGIQSDVASPQSNGAPWFVWERVQNGVFTYDYIKPAASGDNQVTLMWWHGENTAVFYVGSTPIATIDLTMHPRLFFNAEANGRLNGDIVNSQVKNTQVSFGEDCGSNCKLNGAWNTSDFNFYGLHATNTNGLTQNGANFSISGTVSGIPAGLDWDTTPQPVAGIGMIAQYWYGQ